MDQWIYFRGLVEFLDLKDRHGKEECTHFPYISRKIIPLFLLNVKKDLKFYTDYLVKFTPPIFHPNVFDNGSICLSILKAEKNYSASLSMTQLLQGIQTLLVEPNIHDPANWDAREMYTKSKAQFDKQTRAFAKKCADWANNDDE
jgi:hypothetical protein